MTKLQIKQIAAQASNNESRSCKGKVRYKSLKAIKNAIEQIKQKRSVQIKGFNNEAYHCQFCDGWHLGNKVKYAKNA